ncbi:uncharacterized protein GGS25DRAFT_495129 [Hypoxylon fragiforme]|uniref:uncharacterized protein n=1 Tax=Hypoxylon fragiforme TaxID=63214 RepID=UPI0020C6D994|nr:uncharacterized protein GGS25DRAFT_495129 [Hypoxylon fragiforme]KAI2607287.1 hypothetical protein GGS25DRAFT_495129 [Hypoxylon fragiforme]
MMKGNIIDIMLEQDMSIVVFNLLPSSVQSRLPAFQSLRRSTRLSILSRRRSVSPQKGPAEQVMISRTDEDSVVSLQTGSEVPVATDAPSTHNENVRLKPVVPGGNADAGVKWRYAAQGSYLQQSASQETTDLAFARKSFIDGVAYMLKALPDDMDDYEASVIRRALPMPCVQVDGDGRIAAGSGGLGWQPSDRAKTFVHSTVQGCVASLVFFAYIFLSFLAVVIRTGAYFERQYNISEHLISNSYLFATTVGKHSGALGEKIHTISEGKLGKTLVELTAWTVENVSRGVQDGIGQGLLLIQQRQNK